MKEFFEKIVAWVKEHPLLALGIAGGIGLVIYLGLKNGWFGGGGGGEAASAPSPLPDGSASIGGGGGGDYSNLPDQTPILSDQTPIGQSPNPISVTLPSSKAWNEAPMSPFSKRSENLTPAPTVAPSIFTPAPASSDSNYYTGVTVTSPSMQALQPAPAASIAAPKTKKLSPEPAKEKIVGKGKGSKVLTPTQVLGKGAHFTGTINGVYYVNGYPALSGGSTVTLNPVAYQEAYEKGNRPAVTEKRGLKY